MGRMELTAFDMKLQDVKNDMDAVIWKWVNKGVMSQLKHLEDVDTQTGGAMAIISELRIGEV